MTVAQIIDQLLTYPALAAEVGDRMFPVGLPADTLQPAITYAIVEDRQITSKDGPSGTRMTVFRFTVWSQVQLKGREVAKILRDGVAWLGTTGFVHNVIPGSSSDDVWPDPFAWLVFLSYAIWWKE